jgi:hypothetical protein
MQPQCSSLHLNAVYRLLCPELVAAMLLIAMGFGRLGFVG